MAQVLEASRRLFAARGFTETSMRDIADELGIRAPSLYNHVQSKHHLLDMIISEQLDGGDAMLRDTRAGTAPATELVDRLMRLHVRYRLERPEATQIISRETMNLSPEQRTRLLDSRAAYLEHWQSIIEAGVAEGVFTVSRPEISAVVLAGLFDYIQVQVLSLEKGIPEGELEDWYSAHAIGMLTG